MEDGILYMNPIRPYENNLDTMWNWGKEGAKNIFKQKSKKGAISNKIVS